MFSFVKIALIIVIYLYFVYYVLYIMWINIIVIHKCCVNITYVLPLYTLLKDYFKNWKSFRWNSEIFTQRTEPFQPKDLKIIHFFKYVFWLGGGEHCPRGPSCSRERNINNPSVHAARVFVTLDMPLFIHQKILERVAKIWTNHICTLSWRVTHYCVVEIWNLLKISRACST